MNPKVIIVGAGAAGYAAACRLLEKGINNIVILEAENRIGGRVHSIKFGDGIVDLGAQWCHGEKGNIVYDMVKNYNMLQPSFNNYQDLSFVDVDGKFVDKTLSRKLNEIAFLIYEDEDGLREQKGNYSNFFNKRFNEEVDKESIDKNIAAKVLTWFHKFINSINASSTLDELSAKGNMEYKECDGDLTLSWKDGGFETIFHVLKKSFPDKTEELPVDEKILFNKEVTCINWNMRSTDGVIVDCLDNTTYTGDYLISTVSLGVLKEKYRSLFQPLLPDSKIKAIKGLAFGSCAKILLKFETKWWPDDCKGFSFLVPDGYFDKESSDVVKPFYEDGRSWLESIFGFYPIDNNPKVLLGWASGPYIYEIEQIPDEKIIEGCLFLLNRYVGQHYNISKLESMTRSNWSSNPHFRGTYSFISVETDCMHTSAAELAKPLDDKRGKPVVFFAGEATHSSYFSTVHGAIETGFREADQIIKQCGKSGCEFRSRL